MKAVTGVPVYQTTMQESAKKQPITELHEARDLVSGEMEAVNQLIHRRLDSDVALIGQLSHYIINSGGKRLRPLLVLLAARAAGYAGNRHIDLAAVIEFIHTATLLHDDVVDNSELRRGQQTANAVWGNQATVLVGDFLYSRAFEMMVDVSDMAVMDVMAKTTNAIAEGEVMQLMNCHEPDTTEARYMEVIYRKTARLFEAGAELGAILARTDEQIRQALADYGRQIGNAFQLIDDLLDYQSSSGEIGKNVGDDLAEGKPTLPLIHAMRHAQPGEVEIIRTAIAEGDRGAIDKILQIVESTGAIAYTAGKARDASEQAIRALAPLRPSKFRDALFGLAEYAVSRTY